MPRITCRCGEVLTVNSGASERLTCPRCAARIHVRRDPSLKVNLDSKGDGYARFYCPCGRRLKVRVQSRPSAGKCPDCGRVVPIPSSVFEHVTNFQGAVDSLGPQISEPEARTADLDQEDLLRLEQWWIHHRSQVEQTNTEPQQLPQTFSKVDESLPSVRLAGRNMNEQLGIGVEAGLRVCSHCGIPLHINAIICRFCGQATHKR